MLTYFIFLDLFSKKYGLILKGKPSEQVVIVEEELDGKDIVDIRNLQDSPRLVLINVECGNLIVVNDDGKPTRNINQKKKLVVLQQ